MVFRILFKEFLSLALSISLSFSIYFVVAWVFIFWVDKNFLFFK